MDLGLRGKVAHVMASSEGLGRAAAEALAAEGARVGICARRKEPLEAAAKAIRSATGAEVVATVADVARQGESARAIDATVAAFGGRGLQVLVNNGGGPPTARFEDLDDAAWQHAFELLVLSNVRACRAALPHLRAHGGAVVNIVSTSAKQPIDSLLLSNSLRLAVVGLAKTLSLEWGGHGIRVNNVCPGSFLTQRIEEVVAAQARREGTRVEEARAARERSVPLGRFGKPSELADVIAFLASPRAAYVTGQTWTVDGGAVRAVFG